MVEDPDTTRTNTNRPTEARPKWKQSTAAVNRTATFLPMATIAPNPRRAGITAWSTTRNPQTVNPYFYGYE